MTARLKIAREGCKEIIEVDDLRDLREGDVSINDASRQPEVVLSNQYGVITLISEGVNCIFVRASFVEDLKIEDSDIGYNAGGNSIGRGYHNGVPEHRRIYEELAHKLDLGERLREKFGQPILTT